MLFHNEKKSGMSLCAQADQEEKLPPSRSPTAPPRIGRSSTLSRVKRFGSKLTRTNSTSFLSSKKKAPELQSLFSPSPLPSIITTTTAATITTTTIPMDEAGPPPPCSSSSQTSTDDDDDDDDDNERLTTPTSDVGPPMASNYDDNPMCVPPSLLQQPLALESSSRPSAKAWALNPTTTMVRTELLRTFEQVDQELEAELELKRTQMTQSLYNMTRHRYTFLNH